MAPPAAARSPCGGGGLCHIGGSAAPGVPSWLRGAVLAQPSGKARLGMKRLEGGGGGSSRESCRRAGLLRVAEHWSRLCGACEESACLETFQTHLCLWVTLPRQMELISRRSLLILPVGWLCLGCFLPQDWRLAGCVPCAARAQLSCSCCPALCPLAGHLWQGPRGCCHPAPPLHAKIHSKGRAGTSAGSTGQLVSWFCSPLGSFLPLLSTSYGCRRKESLNIL